MATETNYRRSGYIPMSDDPQVRHRIEQELNKRALIPNHISTAYPDRGNDLYLKVKTIIASAPSNPVIIEPTLLQEKTLLKDTLLIMCSFGSNATRIASVMQAVSILTKMNPIPKVVFCEGTTDGTWHFDYVKGYDNFDYLPVDLSTPNFINFFAKECLWNYAANTIMEKDDKIKKLVFLDADCFFVDQWGFTEITKALDTYEIISPHRACYYTGNGPEAKRYGLLNSIGYCVAKNMSKSGYQGYSIGMTKDAYFTYFNNELPNPSLGCGDILYWYMLTGRKQMKGFRMLPYNEKACEDYLLPEGIRIGHAHQIIGHIDHGRVDDRVYKVRAQLMKMAVPVPLKEVARVNEGYILGWAQNPISEDLQYSYERLMIENRREIKISSYEDTIQFYDWIHGRTDKPPKAILPNRFTVTGNKMPLAECAMPVVHHVPTRIPY